VCACACTLGLWVGARGLVCVPVRDCASSAVLSKSMLLVTCLRHSWSVVCGRLSPARVLSRSWCSQPKVHGNHCDAECGSVHFTSCTQFCFPSSPHYPFIFASPAALPCHSRACRISGVVFVGPATIVDVLHSSHPIGLAHHNNLPRFAPCPNHSHSAQVASLPDWQH
jgi:hypothetical protein